MGEAHGCEGGGGRQGVGLPGVDRGQGNLQGRMKRRGIRNGMIVREQPHVQKLRIMAQRMMIRMVIEKIQQPPRRRRTRCSVDSFWMLWSASVRPGAAATEINIKSANKGVRERSTCVP